MKSEVNSSARPLPDHPLFMQQPGLWSAVQSGLRLKNFHKHDMVFHHGDAAAFFWIVQRGWVKMVRQTPDGKESVTGLCTAGDVLGEAALFAYANYPYSAEVLDEDTQLVAIPAELLRERVKASPEFSGQVMSLLNERMAQTQLKLEQMHTMAAAQRLGCFLLRLCHAKTHGQFKLHIPLEKNVLAAYLGMKPETLSRSQQQLREAGVEVAGAQVHIHDVAALREYVCSSCAESGNCDAECDKH